MFFKVVFFVCLMFFCTMKSWAADYDFDTLKAALLLNSPKLKHSEIDIQIAKENVDLAYSGYYPSIRVLSNIERSAKYGRLQTPSFIGEDSLIQSTGRHASVSLNTNYEIFNFGSTAFSVRAANLNRISAISLQCIREKELLLQLLEAYSKLRMSNLQLNEYAKIQELYKELYVMSKRLHESGMRAKIDYMEYAQELANVVVTISNIKEQRLNHLSIIGQLSNIYINENDDLAPLENSTYAKNVMFDGSASAMRARMLIMQKEEEIKLLKTRFLPSFFLYGKYDMYGGDIDSYDAAFDNFEKNGYRFGVGFSWSIFDGFKNKNELEIKKAELLQARFAYQDAKDEYEKEQLLISSQIRLQQDALMDINNGANTAEEITESSQRLYDGGEFDKITLSLNKINQHRTLTVQHETQEMLAMNHKKQEIIAEKESVCAAL